MLYVSRTAGTTYKSAALVDRRAALDALYDGQYGASLRGPQKALLRGPPAPRLLRTVLVVWEKHALPRLIVFPNSRKACRGFSLSLSLSPSLSFRALDFLRLFGPAPFLFPPTRRLAHDKPSETAGSAGDPFGGYAQGSSCTEIDVITVGALPAEHSRGGAVERSKVFEKDSAFSNASSFAENGGRRVCRRGAATVRARRRDQLKGAAASLAPVTPRPRRATARVRGVESAPPFGGRETSRGAIHVRETGTSAAPNGRGSWHPPTHTRASVSPTHTRANCPNAIERREARPLKGAHTAQSLLVFFLSVRFCSSSLFL